MLKKLRKYQRGAIFVEYGLLTTLIAVLCVIAVAALGESVLGLFQPGVLLEAF